MSRRWVFAVVVSTAFHGALIAGFRVLVARAHRADREAAAVAAAPVLARAATQVEFIRVGVLPRAAPVPSARPVTPGLGPAAVPPAMAPLAPRATGPAAEPPPEEPADHRAAGLPPLAPESAAAVVAEGPSAEVIAKVQARLTQGATKCYPAAAQRFRQRGVVNVSFCATASGAIEQVTLGTSSGSTLLDRAATDCVVQSANPLPVEAAGACFRLPVRFGQE